MPENDQKLIGVDGADPRGYERFEGVVSPRSSESSPWWPPRRYARAGAPNVVVILVDDMGFSDIEPFGSEIPTPALTALAVDGYRFTNFRVTPLCAPSRAALLTGANPHRAGFGFVPHVDPGFPGMNMTVPADLPTLAESFRGNGYATFMVGKWHLTRECDMHDGGDKATWPLQRGFDRYFGCMDGFTTMYHPHRIVRDNSPVTDQFADDDYLTDRLTDEAIGMVDALRTGSNQPFFLYFAHTAVHGPVQAKAADIARHRGAYDTGWDRIRRARHERQVAAGLFPDGTELSRSGPELTDGVPAWEDLDHESQALYARHMEVYAGAISSLDDSVARVVDHLKRIGEYENTIIVFTSDNGGTGEGGLKGTRSYFSRFTTGADLPVDWVADVPRDLDDLGGPRVHGHYPRGWAHVSNTPFRLYKGSVMEGGVHSPLMLSWPAGLPRYDGDDGLRAGFAYITDLAPTLLELAGAERPVELGGRPTADADGESLAGLITGSGRKRSGQHITLLGQRSFYEGRWKLVATRPGSLDDTSLWALYDIESDPTEQHDVAAAHPDVVTRLAEGWRRAAWHNTVFPIPDEPTFMARRPSTDLLLEQPVRLRPGMPTLERYRSAGLTSLRTFTVEVRLAGALGEGVLFSHGDQGGGYAVWTEDGRIHLSYNAYGDMHRVSAAIGPMLDGLRVSFDALPDFAWRIGVRVGDDEILALERVPMLIGMAPFTGISVGRDAGGPVDWELHERRGTFPYSGALEEVRYVPGPKAPYDRRIILAVDEATARLMD